MTRGQPPLGLATVCTWSCPSGIFYGAVITLYINYGNNHNNKLISEKLRTISSICLSSSSLYIGG